MKKDLGKTILAGAGFTALAVYIYFPHIKYFNLDDFIYIINMILAGAGCLLVLRRWFVSYTCAFFAGCFFAFGPYFIGMSRFHPSAGFAIAMVPWLFLPAVYCPRKWNFLRIPLAMIPFIFIPVFFIVSSRFGLFAIPISYKLRAPDLIAFVFPLFSIVKDKISLGFYHTGLPLLIIGLVMLIKARRWWLLGVLFAGLILSAANPVFKVSPLIWLSFTVLCFAGAIGLGAEGMIMAGYNDRKWILAQTALLVGLEAISLFYYFRCSKIFLNLGHKYAGIFLMEAKLYGLALLAFAIIFFLVKSRVRQHWLRWTVLLTALTLDLVLSSTFMLDRIF